MWDITTRTHNTTFNIIRKHSSKVTFYLSLQSWSINTEIYVHCIFKSVIFFIGGIAVMDEPFANNILYFTKKNSFYFCFTQVHIIISEIKRV